MNIPERIRIGDNVYDIRSVRIIDWKNDVIGQINYVKKQIKLKVVDEPKLYEANFFHEVSHGMMRELEFNYPQLVKFRNDEVFIQEFALIMRNVFLDLLKNQGDNDEKRL